ncbi:DUF1275 family protein [Ktedonospora formicarum]|uniref:DUF1275 domain-containing protein n=1 Tax=Ktedonospora formicarum TaxID=2778364 RepID=A0A8J3ID07_9CHLR|nr:DUF1275 family protein [Ktedonospora formicarum]GHO50940.1 hypothetical protein KSX_91030 [Ktedonospora formicarum]
MRQPGTRLQATAHLSLSTVQGRNAMVLLLSCVSSSMDAISFLLLGRVFIANMTGNVMFAQFEG